MPSPPNSVGSKSTMFSIRSLHSFIRLFVRTYLVTAISSDVVLEARLPWGRKLWCLGLMPAASVFHWLASATEILPLPCLGLDLTASVSPWLIWLMGKPHKTQILVMGYAYWNPWWVMLGYCKPCIFLLMGKLRNNTEWWLVVSQDKPHNLSIRCLALP